MVVGCWLLVVGCWLLVVVAAFGFPPSFSVDTLFSLPRHFFKEVKFDYNGDSTGRGGMLQQTVVRRSLLS
ncbi:MAG: hypothetical protein AAFS12_19810 [Cyanobacteria bacterium J06632_19]